MPKNASYEVPLLEEKAGMELTLGKGRNSRKTFFLS
jgi:hypothetical protein